MGISRQVQEHCATLDAYAADSFSKLYLLNEAKDTKEIIEETRARALAEPKQKFK